MNKLLIDEVVENLRFTIYKWVDKNYDVSPKVTVYMNYDFWQQCMSEVAQGYHPVQDSFINSYYINEGKQTLIGYRVYKVVDNDHPDYVFRITN
jgi:hypothetical protein